ALSLRPLAGAAVDREASGILRSGPFRPGDVERSAQADKLRGGVERTGEIVGKQADARHRHAAPAPNILPGFIRPCGSSSCLMPRISSMSSGLATRASRPRLVIPMP